MPLARDFTLSIEHATAAIIMVSEKGGEKITSAPVIAPQPSASRDDEKTVPTSANDDLPRPPLTTDARIASRQNDGDGRDGDVDGEGEGENEGDIDGPPKKLPFSKARCIALVTTLTGASFMNVRFPIARGPSVQTCSRLKHDHD